MTQIVLINGEKLVGKSTFANDLANALYESEIHARVYSMVGPLEQMVRNFLNAPDVPYDELKKMVAIPGLPYDGRDLMILQGNAFRNLNPYTLNQIFLNQIKDNPEIEVWIIENWGFQSEYEFFYEPGNTPSKMITIHLDARATRQYDHLEQFDGDNRICLRAIADFVNPKVSDIADIIRGHAMVDPVDFHYSMAESMERLDPDDNGHWAPDGRVNLDYVRKMMKDPTISQLDLDAFTIIHGTPDRSTLESWRRLGQAAEEAPGVPETGVSEKLSPV
jgi:hypothetical protein